MNKAKDYEDNYKVNKVNKSRHNYNYSKDNYRAKYCSIVIQPKIKEFDWSQLEENQIEKKLMELSFPLWTEVVNVLKKLQAESVNKISYKNVVYWAFGTETSVLTKIPHYQIYSEFPVIIRKSSVFEELDKLLDGRVHIVVEKVYNEDYKLYCLKETSVFEFDGKYYWNMKCSSDGKQFAENKLVNMRPKLKMIKDNLFTGQKLLKKMANSEPDDRTGLWLADIIGGTGKTAFFQSILQDIDNEGCYLRVSNGVERLSAKLRKKIQGRLSAKKGYPRWIWINFGRTVEESSLKAFADFGEQILDGMLDDNFGNSATEDFEPLPYLNLIVTANTPPNLRQLTGDRLKLLTLFPVFKDITTFELQESYLIPIFVEIKVRVQKQTMRNMLQYKYKVRLQSHEYVRANFSKFDYYEDLLNNIANYEEFTKTTAYKDQRYQSKLETDWEYATPHSVQKDIFNVYGKACSYSVTVIGPGENQKYIEASSFKESYTKVYNVESL